MLIIPSWSSSFPRDLTAPPALLLRGASLADGRVADVTTAGGVIVSVTEERAGHPASAEVLNLQGYLLLPSFAEPHAYLGRALTGDGGSGLQRRSAQAPGGSPMGGTLALPADPAARAWAAFMSHLVNGTTAIRAHVDVADARGLEALQVLVDVRTSLTGVMDIQIVAVASSPVAGRAGARHRGALRYALAVGAELGGGGAAREDQPDRAVESLAVTAADAGAGLDLQVGETPDRAVSTLSRMVVISEAGFSDPVTASRVTSLAISPERRPAFLRSLERAGIGAVTVPNVPPDSGGGSAWGLAGVRHLLGAGVTVAAGGGGQQDPGGPLSGADPLVAASLLAAAVRLAPAAALTAITSAGRQIMRLPEVMIAPGFPADLVAVRAADLRQAMASGTPDRIVLRGGRVVARARAGHESALPEFHAMSPVWN
jgi:cytosine/creatinine deaminase